MSQPEYTVFIRVPIPRGDFVDPPPVHWDSSKDDEALWKILSGAAQKEIDWSAVAMQFDVPVDFLSQQVAYLTERHASQVRAQVRKATAAARGFGAPSPVPSSEPAVSAHQRTVSALSARRDSLVPRKEPGTSGTTTTIPARPNMSRGTSINTIVLKDGASSSPRHGTSLSSRAGDHGARKRLSSMPLPSPTLKSPDPQAAPIHDGTTSPDLAESSSTESSDNESSPGQSRIIRRPPRYQQNEDTELYQNDGDDESEPAFQPYHPNSDQVGQDMRSTLRGDERVTGRETHRNFLKDCSHQSQTSEDSSTDSPVAVQKPKLRELKTLGPLSPRRTTELAGTNKVKASSQEGSEGTPSMGSSFSDLDDASVTQSALEEAFASHMNRPGASSRFSISHAFRSRYNSSSH